MAPSLLLLLAHVRSFLANYGDTRLNLFHTTRREFHEVSLKTFRQTMAALIVLRTKRFDCPTGSR